MAARSAAVLDAIARNKEPEGRISRTFSPGGRIGVRTYLTRSVLALMAMGLVTALSAATLAASMPENGDRAITLLERGFMVLVAATIFVSLFYMLMMSIRRLHDLEMSGWFYPLCLIPIVGSIFSLYMTFAPGKTDENDYGEFYEPTTIDTVIGGLSMVLIILGLIGVIVGTVTGAI